MISLTAWPDSEGPALVDAAAELVYSVVTAGPPNYEWSQCGALEIMRSLLRHVVVSR